MTVTVNPTDSRLSGIENETPIMGNRADEHRDRQTIEAFFGKDGMIHEAGRSRGKGFERRRG